MLRYESYRYLWPPRPENAQAAHLLHTYEAAGWWAQPKMNGTCTVIAISPEGEMHVRTRHGDVAPASWSPSQHHADAFRDWPGWNVIVAELLHSKGGGIKDTLYINDLLVAGGDYLVGVPYRARQARLYRLCRVTDTGEPTHHEIAPGIWLARNFTSRFRELFAEWDQPYVEGLVLKDPKAPLKICSSPTANGSWSAKVRNESTLPSFARRALQR